MVVHIAVYLKMALRLSFSSRLLYLFGMNSSCNTGMVCKQWTALYRKSLTLPFSGIVVLWAGDFRQNLPVVEKGSREDIIYASIQHSYLLAACAHIPFDLKYAAWAESRETGHCSGSYLLVRGPISRMVV
jgi:hypothetical protein